MGVLPEGALIQKASNGQSYVFFPSYYYDKYATTHNKEKQRRLYIGKLVNGEFIPNKRFLANPSLSRQNVDSVVSEPVDLSKLTSSSYGATSLLKSLADKVKLTKDLELVFGSDIANQLLSLAMFMILESDSALSLYPLWRRMFWAPSEASLTSQYTSKLLAMIGQDQQALKTFFHARVRHIRAHEYLSYDSTKIASTAKDIHDVRWAPSKSGNYQQEIGLAILCGQSSRMPVMFRVLPGNVPDVRTVHDLLCRWDEIGIVKDATAVLDRGYSSKANLAELCEHSVKFVIGQKTSLALIQECIEDDMPKFWEAKHYLGEYNLFGVTHEKTITGSDGQSHRLWIHLFRSDLNCSTATQALERQLSQYERAWSDGTASTSASIRRMFKPLSGVPGDGSKLVRDFDVIDAELRYKGFFAFASNSVKTAREALAIYRGRDCVEKTFASLQTGLDFSSAGVHHDDTLRGKLLASMTALTMVAALSYEMEKEKTIQGNFFPRLYKDYTLKELLHELMNIKIIAGKNITPRVSEATQKQLAIFDRVGVPRPSV